MTTSNKTVGIKSIKVDQYKFMFSTNQKGKPTCSIYKAPTKGIYKGEYKFVEGYYFQTEERMKEWLNEKISNITKSLKRKQEEEEEKKQARKEARNAFKPGQILYSSWGYDQTNVSFYKILEIKGSYAHIIELSQITISKPGYSEMSCYVKPGNEEIGEPLKLKISTSVYNGTANYFLKISRSEYLYEYTNGENGTYCSWYA